MPRYNHVKQWRLVTKQRLVAGFGSKCGACGLVDHEVVYDFHHLDPHQKDFAMTAKVRSWAALVAEAKKCAMLCSHCHRKVHMGLLDVPPCAPEFDERLVAASCFSARKPAVFDSCPVCGGEKPAIRKSCSRRCAGSLKGTGKRPSDIEAMVTRIETSGYRAVSLAIGVSDCTLRKWIRSAGYRPPTFHKQPLP